MKRIRKLLLSVGTLLLLILSLFCFPTVWGYFNPQRTPIGYYGIAPTVVAVKCGLESLTDNTPPVPSGVRAERNIVYKILGKDTLRIDLFLPAEGIRNAPLIFFIHGGAWAHGNRNEYLNYALHFASIGYATATVDYRLVPDHPFPACVEDVREAVGFLGREAEKYHLDPKRTVLAGGSAGAHLAMLTAFGMTREVSADSTVTIRGLIDLYGPTDLTTEYARTQRMVTRLMGQAYTAIPQAYHEASPLFLATKNSPPTLIIHGTRDNLVPIGQAEQLKTKLDSLGVPVTWLPLPGWPHTMDLVSRPNRFIKSEIEKFLDLYVPL
ncbi:MAG: alpha/beta hydrolase [Marinilabiliales bacterium]|nr:alpha/beta hydrolase [Marinilabiliales bacterium]